jgi:UDP-2-acetamido-3-amino-2,3-dideoxy-glucuronate N-acetyltransferase
MAQGGKSLIENPKVALIGCGYWGKNLCRNFSALGSLAQVVDPTDSGQAMAKKLAPQVPVSSVIEDALADPSVHAVALATPAETHAELAIRAMESGKDVFVEKPMALTLGDAERMRDVATREGRILMVGHLLEYHPAVLKLRELVDGNALGGINYIYSNRLNFGKVRTEENALWSFAPHDVAVILRLFGESPIEVSATGGSYLTEGLADVTVSNLRFSNESRAHIFVSWLHPFKEQRLVVVGDQKMVIFNDLAPFGEKLLLYPNTVEFEDKLPVLRKEDAQFIEHDEIEPLREECLHFLDCVSTRAQPLTDAASGIENLKVLEACQSSIEQRGVPVSI